MVHPREHICSDVLCLVTLLVLLTASATYVLFVALDSLTYVVCMCVCSDLCLHPVLPVLSVAFLFIPLVHLDVVLCSRV